MNLKEYIRLRETIRVNCRIGESVSDPGAVHSTAIRTIELITRSAYESLTPKNPATMYVVTDDTETAEEEEGSE